MNDFETRARAAARAVRDATNASADAPLDAPADALTSLPRRRSAVRPLLVAAAVVTVIAVGASVLVGGRDNRGATAGEIADYCGLLQRQADQRALDRQDPDHNPEDPEANAEIMRQALAVAPDELRADLEVIRAMGNDLSKAETDELHAFEESASRLYAWQETNCYPEAAQPNATLEDQRFAPEPLPSDSQVCAVFNQPVPAPEEPDDSHITIYADTSLEDPWTGPLLATAVADFYLLDVEDEEPIAVAGHPLAMSGSIVGATGDPLESGTGIEWDDAHGGHVAVLARGEPLGRQLTSLAEHVVDVNGNPQLDPTFVPPGYSIVYDGSVVPLTDPFERGATFAVNAATADSEPGPLQGMGIRWSGSLMDDATFAASRFLGSDRRLRDITGKTAIVSTTKSEDGTSETYARWREPDGVVITAAWYGKNSEREIESLISTMRRLDRDGWTNLTSQFDFCGTISSQVSDGHSESRTNSGTTSETTVPTVAP